jgi:hypothetical protein
MALPAGSALASIEASPLAAALRDSPWLYPSVETLHLIGVALLFGSIAVLDLRLLGLGRSLSVRRLSAHVLPWTLLGFVFVVPSGLALFVTYASDYIASTLFAVKMSLIFAAGCNAAFFHAAIAGSLARWDLDAAPPIGARLAGAASLIIWASVIACGRWLAYT